VVLEGEGLTYSTRVCLPSKVRVEKVAVYAEMQSGVVLKAMKANPRGFCVVWSRGRVMLPRPDNEEKVS